MDISKCARVAISGLVFAAAAAVTAGALAPTSAQATAPCNGFNGGGGGGTNIIYNPLQSYSPVTFFRD